MTHEEFNACINSATERENSDKLLGKRERGIGRKQERAKIIAVIEEMIAKYERNEGNEKYDDGYLLGLAEAIDQLRNKEE